MANYVRIMEKLATYLPRTEGTAGKISVGRKQLELLAKNIKGTEDREALQKLLTKIKDPKVDIAYKAKSNYTIAGLRIRDGKQVIGNGAISMTDPGKSFNVIKTRLSIGENGKLFNGRGFIDPQQKADAADSAMSLVRKKGVTTADVSSGKAFAAHVEADEKGLVDGARTLGLEEAVQGYEKGTKKLQQSADEFMGKVRLFLIGHREPKVSKMAATCEVPTPMATKSLHGIKPELVFGKGNTALKKADIEEFMAKLGDCKEKMAYASKLKKVNYTIDEYGQIHFDKV